LHNINQLIIYYILNSQVLKKENLVTLKQKSIGRVLMGIMKWKIKPIWSVALLLVIGLLYYLHKQATTEQATTEQATTEQATTEQATPAQTATEQTVGRLGGGYKNAKWGMSKEDVIAALALPVVDSSSNTIVFRGDIKIVCSFSDYGLYLVKVEPSCSNRTDFEAILSHMESKYGVATRRTDMVDGRIGFPLIYCIWDDEVTKIILSMIDPSSNGYRDAGFSDSEAFESLKISYSSLEFENQKGIKAQQEEQKKLEEAKKKVSSDL
jgi:hypothetical protein